VPIIEDGLNPDWRRDLIDWAARNDAVREVWVFGSRGPKALATADSDLDVGIVLAPPKDKTDWAFGNYMALGDGWQADLAALVGRHVSLQAMLPGNKGDVEIRSTGERIWQRD
jgi:hypothetical protein